jgi:peroxisomal enoyl-CoA hydratase 2
MSGPGAGHQYTPYAVSWYKRDVLLFANSIGATVDELHFLYVRRSTLFPNFYLLTTIKELHPDFAVFPTYSIILPFKHTNAEVIDFYAAQNSARESIPGVPKLDSKRVVDGERHIQFFKPLPTSSEGRSFEIRGKVVGVYDKGKATVLETQNDLVDAKTGELYSRATGSGFFVGQGGWGEYA